MKEAIGGTWLFQIVIVFILLFAGYMCLSINHSKAFGIKSEIVESLSRHGGVDKKEIQNILSKASYRTSGSCNKFEDQGAQRCTNPSGTKSTPNKCWYGYDREGKETSGSNATFCIKRISVSSENPELPQMFYYKVKVFYQLDLPVFNSLFSFVVNGDTTILYGQN
ncbi:MAG: hypothetical protein J6W64_01745 [Bacilli bacterium]|nr:hypothetical protein [Bacilli bacterium]